MLPSAGSLKYCPPFPDSSDFPFSFKYIDFDFTGPSSVLLTKGKTVGSQFTARNVTSVLMI